MAEIEHEMYTILHGATGNANETSGSNGTDASTVDDVDEVADDEEGSDVEDKPSEEWGFINEENLKEN